MSHRIVLVAALVLAACGGGGERYGDLSACVADHVAQGLPEPHAITHCLVDFDLGQDFGDIPGCVAYVTAHGSYPDSRQAACEDYFVQTGQVDGAP